MSRTRETSRAERRVGWRLLWLLWAWAICVFVVVDLFWTVPAFDGIRPRATTYRAARYAAHKLVGEPYYDGDFPNESPPDPRHARRAVDRGGLAALPEEERERIFAKLCTEAREGADAGIRLDALRAMAEVLGASARETLLEAVYDDERVAQVRAEAARSIGGTGEGALEILNELLDADLPERVREGVVLGYAETKSPAAAARVLALAAEEASLVRVMAVRAIERFDRPETIPVLAEAVVDGTTEADARVSACRALGATGDAAAIEPLARIALDPGAPTSVRMAAVESLEGMDHPEGIAALEAACDVAARGVAGRARLGLKRARERQEK